MPAYNCRPFLEEAVRSVLAQSLRDLELIVVNDGSSDGSAGLLAELASQDSRLRVIDQNNQGQVVARNAGCQAARAELIAMMDADDVAPSFRLEMHMSFLKAHPHIGLLGGAMLCFSETSHSSILKCFPQDSNSIRRVLSSGNCFAHNTVVFKRALFEQVGGYRKAFEAAEDYDLWLRIIEHAEPHNLKAPLALYRQHPAQISFSVVRRMAIAACAAKLSARARRAGSKDPSDEWQSVSEAQLRQLGMSEQAIEDAISDAYSGKIAFLACLREIALAEKVAQAGAAFSRKTELSLRSKARRERARVSLAAAKKEWLSWGFSAARFVYYRGLSFGTRLTKEGEL